MFGVRAGIRELTIRMLDATYSLSCGHRLRRHPDGADRVHRRGIADACARAGPGRSRPTAGRVGPVARSGRSYRRVSVAPPCAASTGRSRDQRGRASGVAGGGHDAAKFAIAGGAAGGNGSAGCGHATGDLTRSSCRRRVVGRRSRPSRRRSGNRRRTPCSSRSRKMHAANGSASSCVSPNWTSSAGCLPSVPPADSRRPYG